MRVRRTRTTLLAVTALLAVAGCGGGADEEAGGTDAQQVTASTTLESTWPLTGLPVTGEGSAAQTHPVLVVKMDNTSASAPQVGLGDADLVVEELVEGGMTRLAAFYYSALPETAGPVRSMRASDIGIVAPVGGAMVTSGAAQVTIERIDEAGITYFAEGSDGLYRDSSRAAPYNLFADLTTTADLAELDEAIRPANYLPWGEKAEFPQGQPASSLAAAFSGGHTTNWVYRGGKYVNVNSYAGAGDEFPADTVLVLRVKVGDAGYLDPAGNTVPETQFEGRGQALVFHGGRVVRGTWTKSALDAPVELSTKAGELRVPAGRTWIELVPAATGNVTFKK